MGKYLPHCSCRARLQLRGSLLCDSFARGSSCRLLSARFEKLQPPGQTLSEACYVTCNSMNSRSCVEMSLFIVV